jgi:hypothetical protein
MSWQGEAAGKRGRILTFSDAAIQFCLTIKGLFGLPLRQTTGFVESLLRLTWPIPDYSTLCRRQKTITVDIPYRPSEKCLHLLVDSTGIKMLGEGEWKRKKHGAAYRHQWRKVHLGIDAETLEIRAVEVTENGIGDAPMLPELHKQIPATEPLLSVRGDGAYDTMTGLINICLAVLPRFRNMRQNGYGFTTMNDRTKQMVGYHQSKS